MPGLPFSGDRPVGHSPSPPEFVRGPLHVAGAPYFTHVSKQVGKSFLPISIFLPSVNSSVGLEEKKPW